MYMRSTTQSVTSVRLPTFSSRNLRQRQCLACTVGYLCPDSCLWKINQECLVMAQEKKMGVSEGWLRSRASENVCVRARTVTLASGFCMQCACCVCARFSGCAVICFLLCAHVLSFLTLICHLVPAAWKLTVQLSIERKLSKSRLRLQCNV